MAHDYQSANSHLSHSRTITLTFIAVGFVFLLAVASGIAFNMHGSSSERSSVQTESTSRDNAHDQQAVPVDEADNAGQEKVEPMSEPAPESSSSQSQTTSPGSPNTSHSSTSVTVNGRNVTVDGNGSVKRSYTSPDGHTKVRISIDNSQSGN